MAKYPYDPNRVILSTRAARWANDSKQTLTESELDQVVSYFAESKDADDPDLRRSLRWQFQSFLIDVVKEGFKEVDGELQEVPKPSTRVDRDIRKLSNSGDALYRQFSELDAVSKTWLGQYFRAGDPASRDSSGEKLRELDDRIFYLAQDLAIAVRALDGLVSPGPNKVALRFMIEELAGCWEICYGKPPTTDKGRGRRDDPFLKLCQEMAGIARSRLKKKGGDLGARQLGGLVADVLEKRRREHSR